VKARSHRNAVVQRYYTGTWSWRPKTRENREAKNSSRSAVGALKQVIPTPTGSSDALRNNRPLKRVSSVPVFGGRGVDKDDQKFIAVEGLHAWASAILTQVERLELAREQLARGGRYRRAYLCERHFLLIAAKKLIDYIDWARDLGFLDEIIFGEMARGSAADLTRMSWQRLYHRCWMLCRTTIFRRGRCSGPLGLGVERWRDTHAGEVFARVPAAPLDRRSYNSE